LFATLISIGSVLLEEMTYRRYSDWREVARLLLYGLFEHFPDRQMTLIWRLQGLYQYLHGDLVWREMKRMGVSGRGKCRRVRREATTVQTETRRPGVVNPAQTSQCCKRIHA
jgi:hypothetical protein